MVCPMIRECQVRKSGIETKNINLISSFINAFKQMQHFCILTKANSDNQNEIKTKILPSMG